VNTLRVLSFLRSRYFVATIAGLLWTAAFPKIGIAGFAWIVPGVMVASALGTRKGERFRIGYVAGLAHYLSMLYWLLLIPYRWMGIPFGPALGWLALSGFLALFPAAWVCLVTPTHSGLNIKYSILEGLGAVLPRNWFLRLFWALLGAAAWVGMEMFVARVFGGFAWDLLGVSQFRMTPLIQISSVTGVYGLSFLIVWLSLSLTSAGVMVIKRPHGRSVWVGEVFLPTIVVAVLFNFGMRELRREPASARTIRLTLIQPSIPQELIWDQANDTRRFDELIQLSELALRNQTDCIIWPEAAVPRMLLHDKETYESVTGLARRHQVWMIVGSDDAEPRPGAAAGRPEYEFYNSSFLISPEGKVIERYKKRDLVMFGEYVPLRRWLPFLKYLTPIEEGGFTPGTKTVPFGLASLQVKTQVLICFEDIFPQLARENLRPDIDFLVNLTNDGWFGQGAAQWQQAATGLFRAVENHLPLVRCSNNGLTCWVDDRGVLRDVLADAQGTIYGKGFLPVELPLPAAGTLHAQTFYTRHGDWFGWDCSGVALLWLAVKISKCWRGSTEAVATGDSGKAA